MFEHDYIMREIEMLTRMLGKAIFQKETETIDLLDENGCTSGDGLLYFRLSSLVKQGEINKAEDLLFQEASGASPHAMLRVACQFYDDLNSLSDEQLARGGFSREEIAQGLSDIRKILGGISGGAG